MGELTRINNERDGVKRQRMGWSFTSRQVLYHVSTDETLVVMQLNSNDIIVFPGHQPCGRRRHAVEAMCTHVRGRFSHVWKKPDRWQQLGVSRCRHRDVQSVGSMSCSLGGVLVTKS